MTDDQGAGPGEGDDGGAAPPALALRGITAGYARTTVLRDISLSVPAGAVVALLGPNGAGKTTLLRTASGLLRPGAGQVFIDGVDVTALPPNRRAKAGLCLIPEGRGIFRALSVRDNLRMQIPPWGSSATIESALEIFPVLRDRMGQLAGTLSGGQQQMLALARAHLSQPKVVLLDEVSMGLAPKVVDEIFAVLGRLVDTGAAILLVEQYVNRALSLASSVTLLDRGEVAFDGPAAQLDQNEVLRGYLGMDVTGGTGADGLGGASLADAHGGPTH